MDNDPSKRPYLLRLFRKSIQWPFVAADAVALVAIVGGGGIAKLQPKWASAMGDLTWQVPFGVFGILVLIQLLIAPYLIHREDQGRIRKIQQQLHDRDEADAVLRIISEMLPKAQTLLAAIQLGPTTINVAAGTRRLRDNVVQAIDDIRAQLQEASPRQALLFGDSSDVEGGENPCLIGVRLRAETIVAQLEQIQERLLPS